MKALNLHAAVLLLICAPVLASQQESARTFELPSQAGAGEDKEVSVLLDESHLKLATIALRRGTALPRHSAPVPTTIQVLAGDGVIYAGSEAVPVSTGTILALAADEEHAVTPAPESDMLLLVHYLRGEPSESPEPSAPH